MNVVQHENETFRPVTIVLETEHELRALLTIVNMSDDLDYSDIDVDREAVEEVSRELYGELEQFADPYGA